MPTSGEQLRARDRKTFARAVATVAAVLGVVGCGEHSAAPPSMQVRDSAGVRIVEYAAMPSASSTWSVSSKPSLTIGSLEGEGADVFSGLPLVVQRSDGVIVAADLRTSQLRAFDRTGRHPWTAGRSGQGPGEFGFIRNLFPRSGDSVLVIDSNNGRASIFGPSGAFARMYSWAPPPGEDRLSDILGATSAGRLVARAESFPQTAGYTEGSYSNDNRLVSYDRSGSALPTTVAGFTFEYVYHKQANGLWVGMGLPYGRHLEAAVRDSNVYATDQVRFEIRRYDGQGTLAMILRIHAPPVPVDDAVRKRILSPPPGVELPEGFRISDVAWEFADTLPAMGDLRLDPRGRLWVQDYLTRYGRSDQRWWVFDRGGQLVATATSPDGFMIRQIESDHVVGVVRDSLDVAYVQVRGIER